MAWHPAPDDILKYKVRTLSTIHLRPVYPYMGGKPGSIATDRGISTLVADVHTEMATGRRFARLYGHASHAGYYAAQHEISQVESYNQNRALDEVLTAVDYLFANMVKLIERRAFEEPEAAISLMGIPDECLWRDNIDQWPLIAASEAWPEHWRSRASRLLDTGLFDVQDMYCATIPAQSHGGTPPDYHGVMKDSMDIMAKELLKQTVDINFLGGTKW